MPKPIFNLLKKATDTHAYIYLIFNYWRDGKARIKFRQLVPDARIQPQHFDKKRQRVKYDPSNPTRHNIINARMDDMALHIANIYNENNIGCISPDDMGLELAYRMKWKPRPAPKKEVEQKPIPALFDFIEIFCREREGGKHGTEKVLHTWAELLRKFSKERYRRLLDYQDIDAAFFAAFQKWCYAPPRHHSVNYFYKGLTIVRQFMREAERRKFHENRDYQFFTVKRMPTTKIALSFDELERLYVLDLPQHSGMEKTRDLFLIGAYTGLRFSDFTRIMAEHIDRAEDGKKYLSIVTQKTGTLVTIPLLPIAEKLLEKYGYNVPKVANQNFNDNMKELGKMAGLTGKMFVTNSAGGKRNETILEKWEMLSSHVARRSFATNFYRDGMPVSVLMQITGHATEKQFMAYIKIDGKENAAHFNSIQDRKDAPMTVIKKAG